MTGPGPGPDLRCYLVTSGTGARTVEVAAAAARAGAGVVQVRAKDASDAALTDLVRAVARAVARVAPATRVLVDDRADIAHLLAEQGEAVHGVHLGQDDLPVGRARELLGHRALIGLTTGTVGLAAAAERVRGVIDYVGAGPFRVTPTKDSGRAPLGVEGYRPLVAATSLPVVAIGDVTPEDVPALAGTGVAGVALVRAVMNAPDPAAVVRRVLGGWADAAVTTMGGGRGAFGEPGRARREPAGGRPPGSRETLPPPAPPHGRTS